MTVIPKLTIKYAWDTGSSTGPVYDSPEQARLKAPARHYPLLRLYVDPDGRIIHCEVSHA